MADFPLLSESPFRPAGQVPLAPGKFRDPHRTAKGERRARVPLVALETLWLNTGTLCNLACAMFLTKRIKELLKGLRSNSTFR